MVFTTQQTPHINVEANLKLLTTKGMTPAQLQVPQNALDGMVRYFKSLPPCFDAFTNQKSSGSWLLF
jgi:hypothetical protein